jgi:hypothetical protein
VFSAAAGFAQSTDLQSIILADMSGETNHEWSIAGKTYSYDFEWKTDASRFTTVNDSETFPRQDFVSAFPMSLYGSNRDGADIRSLGIWGRFDRRGYNWIDVYPVPVGGADGETFEIPIPGRLTSVDVWAWGSNKNYTLEVYLRDSRGVVHTIDLGSLSFGGWKNLQVRIPNSIPQSRRALPRVAGLSFVKFRIWTTPADDVSNVYVYLNQLKVITDVFDVMFDGNDLADPERVQELWGQGQQ